MPPSKGTHLRFMNAEVVKRRYQVVDEIGCGNFSKVYRCIDLVESKKMPCDYGSKYVAMKVLKKEFKRDAGYEYKMLRILEKEKRFDTIKIPLLLDFFEHKGCCVFITTLYGPSLRSRRLGINRGVVTKQSLKLFSYHFLRTLQFLHEDCHIVHTDLKPENILIETPMPTDRGIGSKWVVCDYGSASVCVEDHLDSDLIATRPYRAPEVILGNCWDYAADIWSAGCILFEVCVGFRLFEVRDDFSHLLCISRRIGRLPEIFTKHSKYSSKFFNAKGEFARMPDAIREGQVLLDPLKDFIPYDPAFLFLLKQLLQLLPESRARAGQALTFEYFDDIREEMQAAERDSALPEKRSVSRHDREEGKEKVERKEEKEKEQKKKRHETTKDRSASGGDAGGAEQLTSSTIVEGDSSREKDHHTKKAVKSVKEIESNEKKKKKKVMKEEKKGEEKEVPPPTAAVAAPSSALEEERHHSSVQQEKPLEKSSAAPAPPRPLWNSSSSVLQVSSTVPAPSLTSSSPPQETVKDTTVTDRPPRQAKAVASNGRRAMSSPPYSVISRVAPGSRTPKPIATIANRHGGLLHDGKAGGSKAKAGGGTGHVPETPTTSLPSSSSPLWEASSASSVVGVASKRSPMGSAWSSSSTSSPVFHPPSRYTKGKTSKETSFEEGRNGAASAHPVDGDKTKDPPSEMARNTPKAARSVHKAARLLYRSQQPGKTSTSSSSGGGGRPTSKEEVVVLPSASSPSGGGLPPVIAKPVQSSLAASSSSTSFLSSNAAMEGSDALEDSYAIFIKSPIPPPSFDALKQSYASTHTSNMRIPQPSSPSHGSSARAGFPPVLCPSSAGSSYFSPCSPTCSSFPLPDASSHVVAAPTTTGDAPRDLSYTGWDGSPRRKRGVVEASFPPPHLTDRLRQSDRIVKHRHENSPPPLRCSPTPPSSCHKEDSSSQRVKVKNDRTMAATVAAEGVCGEISSSLSTPCATPTRMVKQNPFSPREEQRQQGEPTPPTTTVWIAPPPSPPPYSFPVSTSIHQKGNEGGEGERGEPNVSAKDEKDTKREVTSSALSRTNEVPCTIRARRRSINNTIASVADEAAKKEGESTPIRSSASSSFAAGVPLAQTGETMEDRMEREGGVSRAAPPRAEAHAGGLPHPSSRASSPYLSPSEKEEVGKRPAVWAQHSGVFTSSLKTHPTTKRKSRGRGGGEQGEEDRAPQEGGSAPRETHKKEEKAVEYTMKQEETIASRSVKSKKTPSAAPLGHIGALCGTSSSSSFGAVKHSRLASSSGQIIGPSRLPVSKAAYGAGMGENRIRGKLEATSQESTEHLLKDMEKKSNAVGWGDLEHDAGHVWGKDLEVECSSLLHSVASEGREEKEEENRGAMNTKRRVIKSKVTVGLRRPCELPSSAFKMLSLTTPATVKGAFQRTGVDMGMVNAFGEKAEGLGKPRGRRSKTISALPMACFTPGHEDVAHHRRMSSSDLHSGTCPLSPKDRAHLPFSLQSSLILSSSQRHLSSSSTSRTNSLLSLHSPPFSSEKLGDDADSSTHPLRQDPHRMTKEDEEARRGVEASTTHDAKVKATEEETWRHKGKDGEGSAPQLFTPCNTNKHITHYTGTSLGSPGGGSSKSMSHRTTLPPHTGTCGDEAALRKERSTSRISSTKVRATDGLPDTAPRRGSHLGRRSSS